MATRNISVTYPDGAAATIIAALKWNYGQIEDPPGSGTMRDRTNAEALQAFDASVRAALRDVVQRYQVHQARTTAEAGVTPIDVTA